MLNQQWKRGKSEFEQMHARRPRRWRKPRPTAVLTEELREMTQAMGDPFIG